jgi:hypothetical protein
MKINGVTISSGGGAGIAIPIKPVSGWTYTNLIFNCIANSVTSLLNNSMILNPFIPLNTFTISSIAVTTTNTSAGGKLKILIYSGDIGYPNELLYQSSELLTDVAGLKTQLTSFTFVAGKVYFLGLIASSTAASISLAITAPGDAPVMKAIPGQSNLYTAGFTYNNMFTITTVPRTLAAPAESSFTVGYFIFRFICA